MAAETKRLKDQVLTEEFTAKEQQTIMKTPDSKVAARYYRRLDHLAGENVRREMSGRHLLDVMEERKPDVERDKPFEWVDPKDRSYDDLDEERKHWMRSLRSNGELMLADLFYQSKPDVKPVVENKQWQRSY